MNPAGKAALTILRLWRECIDESKGDPWKFRGERQGYHDSLEALCRAGAIKGYSIETMTVEPEKISRKKARKAR